MRALLPAAVLVLASCGGGAPRRHAEGFSALRSSLQLADPGARAGAAWELGQLGMDSPGGPPETPKQAGLRAEAAAALVPAVSDEDAGVRRAAVEGLGKTGGPEVEDAILNAATDADPGVRGEVALALFRRRLLARVPEYSTVAFSALDMLAADPDAEVRWRAVYAFTRFPDARAKESLVKAQKDPDSRTRLFAARSLAKLGVRPDHELFTDPDLYVRAEAVAACGAAKTACEAPASVYSDPSAHVRAAAADAAAASGRADLAQRLEKMADTDGPLARGRALLALAKLRGAAEAGRLAKARTDADWWVRSRAYEASASLPDGLDILRAGVADPDSRVSSFALEKLAASTAPFVVPLLAEVLKDPKASLETVGSAVDAAAERKTLALVDALIAAGKRVSASAPAEIRDGIKKALLAAADANPAKKAEIVHAMRGLPEPKNDEPARFKPLSSSPTLVLETLKGRIELLLDAKAAPNHAAAIAAQAKKGLYDGTIWHRVVTAFVVQGGDPRGSGWGDAGYRLADEINRLRFERGTLGMPKAGPDTGGCQLFVSVVPTPHLDGRYTAFGKVVSGLEIVDALEPGDKILKGWLK